MKFKRLSLVCLFLTLVSSYAWAEKYEYVRLSHGKTVELNAGDAAMVVAYDPASGYDYLVATDENVKTLYRVDETLEKRMIIVGPATLKADIQRPTRTARLANRSYNIEIKACVTIAIERSSQTGSKTLAWNDDTWQGSDDGTQQANNNSSSPVPDPNGIKYDSLLGWVWFTDTPWMYSYTNGSWYYMRSSNDGIYVWNANLPNSGWMKLRG